MLKNLITKIVAIIFIMTISMSVISFQVTVFAKENVDYTQTYIQSKSNSADSNIVSLYCWEIDDFNLSKLKDEVEYLKINTLYIQRPSNVLQTDRLRQIMEFAKQYKLDVFLLEGARDWLTTGDINKVTEVIDEAYELNQTLDYKLKGVSLDIEFYLTDDYQSSDTERQQELFKSFTENTKKCCDYANDHGLGYSMALPVWLNKLSSETLEDLMNYNYDHIAFMNYFKETIMENIDEEVEIARRHNIKIVSIAEVQNPIYGTVGEEDTFFNNGLTECINTLENIQQKYNYENLGVSYHYYKPLLELLERDTDIGIENKYEIEVYPYKEGNSVNVDEATISSNGVILQPIRGYYNDTKEHIINFYSLEYGKEYTLTVKSGNATATKTFTYQKNDKDLNKLEVVHIKVELEESEQNEKEPEENKPEENKPEENKPEENEPEENEPEENEPEESEPEENKQEENKSEEKKSEEKEQKELKTNEATTMAKSTLPQTGKENFIEKLLMGTIMLVLSLTVINGINQAKNKK